MLHETIMKGYTSLSIRCNDSKPLSVLDITSCTQLEDHYHALGPINMCKQLPPPEIFRIKWGYWFFPESIIDILTDWNLSELAVTTSNWGSPLWAEIFKVLCIVRL